MKIGFFKFQKTNNFLVRKYVLMHFENEIILSVQYNIVLY